MVEGPGGHAVKENIELQNRTVNWPFNWLFRGKTGQSTRKTVTFGDAAEVSGALRWTIFSLIVILALWFISTRVWGLPEAWYDYADDVRAELSQRTRAMASTSCCATANGRPTIPEDFPGLPAVLVYAVAQRGGASESGPSVGRHLGLRPQRLQRLHAVAAPVAELQPLGQGPVLGGGNRSAHRLGYGPVQPLAGHLRPQ